jgi:hypothetical protein
MPDRAKPPTSISTCSYNGSISSKFSADGFRQSAAIVGPLDQVLNDSGSRGGAKVA